MVKVEEIELGLSLSVGGAFKKFKPELGSDKLKKSRSNSKSKGFDKNNYTNAHFLKDRELQEGLS